MATAPGVRGVVGLVGLLVCGVEGEAVGSGAVALGGFCPEAGLSTLSGSGLSVGGLRGLGASPSVLCGYDVGVGRVLSGGGAG